jgi:hypothetical protein
MICLWLVEPRRHALVGKVRSCWRQFPGMVVSQDGPTHDMLRYLPKHDTSHSDKRLFLGFVPTVPQAQREGPDHCSLGTLLESESDHYSADRIE